MMFKSVLVALSLNAMASASVINHKGMHQKRAATSSGSSAASTCLDTNALQTGSFVTGQVNDVPSGGQSNSNTDTANFINFCSGQTLTNGLQVKAGSCNGIVMGKIPATTSMVSTVITNPKLNDNLDANTTFNVTLNVANMQLGSFTNATSTYYAAPQDLSSSGAIIGHVHVTVQDVGSSFDFTTPLDATKFVFFKGINDAGNGQGTVTTAVTGGLPAGNYRVCSMTSSSNHQPVLMPVAQRGAQDDCRYFTVAASNVISTASTPAAVTTAASATTAASTSSGTSSALGGIEAPAVVDSGDANRPFSVNGDTFVNKSAAVQRACSIQNNQCANAVNSGTLSGVTVSDCNAQDAACSA
ncbi:hypothetical protein CMQ_2485 [Grosmannia clavigera kw1407]|uniref:Ribosomal protein s17 n=1 Tax=Grosmannia clavigera (strain kw1407 / UAMH 11150) TaxID=655863 RepID=F0XJ39_GROCL|nr:uncharacterized protein CMQ_2485 [Grosmannia clavigera kw1407]EFX02436.1 hypothetical protein CMQ_2485 [Grosmannia clavigera kw1407]